MVDLLLTVHVVLAVFAVGPLVHAATTASRGMRTGDAAAVAISARTVKIYSYASVLVVLVGMGLMSMDDPDANGVKLGEIGQTWVWLSLVLWAAAVGVSLGLLVPSLTRVAAGAGGGAGNPDTASAATARVAAAGGVVGVAFVVILALMVYRPGH